MKNFDWSRIDTLTGIPTSVTGEYHLTYYNSFPSLYRDTRCAAVLVSGDWKIIIQPLNNVREVIACIERIENYLAICEGAQNG